MGIELHDCAFHMRQLPALRQLFGSYFPAEDKLLTSDYSEWLYADNPFGPAHVVVATEGDCWVGFLAMIPVRLARAGSQKLAYYVVNVLVHPDYQGKHVFGRMITVAKSHAAAQDALLMGHPNRMALPMWKRARMQFRETLKPVLFMPGFGRWGLKSSDVGEAAQVLSLQQALAEQAARSEHWQLIFSWDYLQWRYLKHPSNRYRVRLLKREDRPVAVQVTRQVKPCVHLWIDQFTLVDAALAASTDLPWFTVGFRPSSLAPDLAGGRRWALPVRKEIPFFCTQAGDAGGDHMFASLGLSASDF